MGFTGASPKLAVVNLEVSDDDMFLAETGARPRVFPVSAWALGARDYPLPELSVITALQRP